MSHSGPTRSLSASPSLPQLRKQAKELLRAYRSGDSDAVAEIERFERSPDPATFALADAQRVLARAYGFSSWTELKDHVGGLNVESFCSATEIGDVDTVRRLAAARPEIVHFKGGGRFGEKTALHLAVQSQSGDDTCSRRS